MSALDALGLQFSHRDTEGTNKHIIEATDPDGRFVGMLSLLKSSRGQNVFPAANIEVERGHQRRGVGTALWREAEQSFPEHKFVHAFMSPGGQRLAERMQDRNPDRHILIHDKNLTVKEIEDSL